jgi:hypothetical protein
MRNTREFILEKINMNGITFNNPAEEIKRLRQVISNVATNLGNGSAVSTEASIEFIEDVPREVKLVCEGLRREIASLNKTLKELQDKEFTFEKVLEKDIPKNAVILPSGIEIWQTEDLFIILKDQQDSVAFEKKYLADLVDAMIVLQNI